MWFVSSRNDIFLFLQGVREGMDRIKFNNFSIPGLGDILKMGGETVFIQSFCLGLASEKDFWHPKFADLININQCGKKSKKFMSYFVFR